MITKDKILAVVCIVILLLGSVTFAIFKTDSEEAISPGAMLDATNTFLGSGRSTMITAEALYANLNDGYTGNDPFILSVRSAEAYETGHIPGAVNIAWRSVFTDENISLLPTNKQIVVYCFTGHTASQTTAMLNVMGYDAVCLKWGMASWTTNTTVASGYYDRSSIGEFPYVTGAEPGTWSGGTRSGGTRCGEDPAPSTSGDTGDADTGDLTGIANNYMASGKPPAIPASALQDNLNDGNADNDPFILSIRSSAQYAIGHIPGAVNIGFKTLFTEENLTKLPDDDRQIVVVCYTGHTASQATALLNMNGFNATALKWGMTGWTSDATIAPSYYNRGTACQNYEVTIGTEAGTLDTAVLAGKTDDEILLEAAGDYLAGGPRLIKAPDLQVLLNDTDDTNDPFILSVRGSTDYAKGHIPGAINLPWNSVFSFENLTLLPGDDTLIVVVCYTGQTASHVTALLNVLGFNATTLAHGMSAWTLNQAVVVKSFSAASHQSDYPVEESPGTRDGTRQCGDDGGGSGGIFEGSADEWEMLRQKCEQYVNDGTSLYLTAKALYYNMDDGYPDNDPYILSVRGSTDYDAGHIDGAENIGATSVFNEDNLAKLPKDKQIVVYCYTGQGAAHVSAMLSINGYDSISLKFGMCSWNSTAASKCFTPGSNFRVSTGAAPGDWATATIMPAD